MLTRRSSHPLTSPAQAQVLLSPQLRLVRRSVLATCLHSGKANAKSGDAKPQTVIKVAGDAHIHGDAQAVEWDAVAISPQAKALLQKHAVKASAALQMHRVLGFEDVDDVRRLTPDLVAQLKLKPLQLDNLLDMLQQQQQQQQQQQKLGLVPQAPKTPQPQQLPEEAGKDAVNMDRGVSVEGPRLQHEQQQQQKEDQKLEQKQEQVQQQRQSAAAVELVKHIGRSCWALTPGGRRVVSPHGHNALAVHDTATGALLAIMERKEMSDLPVSTSPEGPAAVFEYTQRVWDFARIAHYARGPELHTWCMAISPDGRQAVSGGGDSAVWLWDLDTYTCIGPMRGHSDSVSKVAITPDGRRAVSGSTDATLRVWDLATRTCIATLTGHTAAVTCMAITPDGRRALSSSGGDLSLRVWDLDIYKCVASMKADSLVRCLAITPDGRHAVTAAATNMETP